MTIRVVLGEDDVLTRSGIVSLIEPLRDIELVAECDNLDDLRTAVDATSADVVLTDIRMPPTHTDEGIRFATELKARRPEVGVIVLSQHVEVVYALDLFADGTDRRAYLLKERIKDRSELERAIRMVADGASFVDPLVMHQVMKARSEPSPTAVDRLTPREREILSLVAAAHSNRAIAGELGISKRAVERHINAIFAKLDLGDSEDVSRRVKAALVYLTGDGSAPSAAL